MPKLWTNNVKEHRHAVRAAALDAADALIAHSGPGAVSMTRVAEQAGITRATLYKYFPDVETLLAAWHERQVHEHLAALARIRADAAGSGHELQAVLEAYALMIYDRRAYEAPHLHTGSHIDHAQQHLEAFIADLIRDDAGDHAGLGPEEHGGTASHGHPGDHAGLGPEDLARYCIHAVGAAASLSSRDAVPLLVGATVRGIRK